jgi:hypothetical protein
MQLLTDDLNSAKGNRDEVPIIAINRLLDRLDSVVADCHSSYSVQRRE